jgi:putative transposase
LIGELGARVWDLVCQSREAFEIKIIKGINSKDHIHILVSAAPNLAPSEVMRRVKGRASSKLFEEFPHVKGYFCATVGQITEE